MIEKDSRINTEQVVGYLSHAFAKATIRAINNGVSRDNYSGTTLYKYQVEFSYLINEIQRGPIYIVPMHIQEANDLIAKLEKERGAKE